MPNWRARRMRLRTDNSLAACKVELLRNSMMSERIAFRTDTTAYLCSLTAEYCASAFFTWCDHGSIQPRRRLLRLAPSLTERPGCQLCPDNDCEEVTEHTDRDSHYGRNDLLHKASPLSVRESQTAWVIQFYRHQAKCQHKW